MWRGSRQLAAALGAMGVFLSTAHASEGRFCGDLVESGRSSGETQQEAETHAKGWWSSRAGTFGRGYESWDNARDRALECTQDNSGKFYCKAEGRPCLPAGALPEDVPKVEM